MVSRDPLLIIAGAKSGGEEGTDDVVGKREVGKPGRCWLEMGLEGTLKGLGIRGGMAAAGAGGVGNASAIECWLLLVMLLFICEIHREAC